MTSLQKSVRERLSVCFVAQNSYGVLAGLDSGFLKGIEVQIPSMARWFVSRGYSVTIICWDEGFGSETIIDGIRVINMRHRDESLVGLRFITPRWTSLYEALRKASPDVIYYNSGDLVLGQIVLWAKMHTVPVVYSVTNDMVCLRDLPSLPRMHERLLYCYGLLNADRIITQTIVQQQRLESNFGLKSQVIPMPSPDFDFEGERIPSFDSDEVCILWVSRFTSEKRLEWLLDLAEHMPDIAFNIVGDASIETDYSQQLKERGARLSNVTMHNRVLHQNMSRFYYSATISYSTSVYEGFPNVFLKAWSTGLPVVATVDPDGVISEFGLGEVGTSVDALEISIRSMLQPERWSPSSLASRKHYKSKHYPELAMGQFNHEVLELLRTKSSSISRSANATCC